MLREEEALLHSRVRRGSFTHPSHWLRCSPIALLGQAPNVVTLLVESGRNLRPPPASVALCDSMVAVKCAGKVKHSKAQKKTNNPRWHFQAQLANNDPSEVIVIEVRSSWVVDGGIQRDPEGSRGTRVAVRQPTGSHP